MPTFRNARSGRNATPAGICRCAARFAMPKPPVPDWGPPRDQPDARPPPLQRLKPKPSGPRHGFGVNGRGSHQAVSYYHPLGLQVSRTQNLGFFVRMAQTLHGRQVTVGRSRRRFAIGCVDNLSSTCRNATCCGGFQPEAQPESADLRRVGWLLGWADGSHGGATSGRPDRAAAAGCAAG